MCTHHVTEEHGSIARTSITLTLDLSTLLQFKKSLRKDPFQLSFSPAERAEMLAYNALPATITPDMWAHQYLQQSNEANAIHSDDHIWEHDGPDSTLCVGWCLFIGFCGISVWEVL